MQSLFAQGHMPLVFFCIYNLWSQGAAVLAVVVHMVWPSLAGGRTENLHQSGSHCTPATDILHCPLAWFTNLPAG
jgi:hypothetical protein